MQEKPCFPFQMSRTHINWLEMSCSTEAGWQPGALLKGTATKFGERVNFPKLILSFSPSFQAQVFNLRATGHQSVEQQIVLVLCSDLIG